MISGYLIEFGNSKNIEKKSDELTEGWNQLSNDLAKKKGDYGHEVERLKTLEEGMAEYETWLSNKKRCMFNLPPLAWNVALLDEQTKYTQVSIHYYDNLLFYS